MVDGGYSGARGGGGPLPFLKTIAKPFTLSRFTSQATIARVLVSTVVSSAALSKDSQRF